MRPVNFEVKEREGDSTDKIIRKFIKKTSKSRVVQIYLDSLNHKTRSQKRREKLCRRKYIKQKIQEEFLLSLKEREQSS